MESLSYVSPGVANRKFALGLSSLNNSAVSLFTLRSLWYLPWMLSFDSLLVFYSCCNKCQWSSCLTTTQTYYLTILQVRSLKIKVSAKVCFHLEVPGENLLSCIFLVLGPSSIFKANSRSSFSLSCSLSLTSSVFTSSLTLLPPPYNYDYSGPIQIIQDNLFISSSLSESHLQSPCEHMREHIYGFWGLGCGLLGVQGGINPPTMLT